MFKISVTPRFGDIDGLRHVNNNVIGVWFEMGRTELFKIFSPNLSLDYEDWKLILAHADYDFLDQIFFDGDVEIRTFITEIGNSSFKVAHEAWQNNKLKAKGSVALVYYDFINQKSMTIPDDIREKLNEHLVI